MLKIVLGFIKNLEANNNREWFQENKSEYDKAKKASEKFLAQIIEQFGKYEPAIADYKPSDCFFRIYRDTRFSNDKTPYKTHFGAYLSVGGKKSDKPGYYLHLKNGETFAGGGLYEAPTPLLNKVRQEIDYNFEMFSSIINKDDFKEFFGELKGEKLKRPPTGYTPDNLAIEWIKLKQWFVMRNFTDEQVLGANFATDVTNTFVAMKPLVDFLTQAYD